MNIKNFHLPRWDELPSIDLYLDQTVTILENYLQDYIGNDQNTVITKTMINNYVKQEIIPPPVKKKYSKSHIAKLFVICTLKQLYSINDIDNLIKMLLSEFAGDNALHMFYNEFCKSMENSICVVFDDEGEFSFEKCDSACLLKYVCFSFAYHLHVKKSIFSETAVSEKVED